MTDEPCIHGKTGPCADCAFLEALCDAAQAERDDYEMARMDEVPQ